MVDFKTGIYRHYKGGMYTAIALVAHHETRHAMVLYVSHSTGEMNVRPLYGWDSDPDGWLDKVDGGVRFELFTENQSIR